jgi:two-component system, chemotaxis family, sensor kinase CheA
MSDGAERAREEFFSEGQELIEILSRSLLSLDEALNEEREEPGLVNEAFRAVHTLKSLAGIFNAKALGTLSHQLEDVLDEVRLGRIPLTRTLLDVMFQAVEMYWQLLAHERHPHGMTPSITGVLERLGRLRPTPGSQPAAPELEFDAALLAVLTEYEEHRLRASVASGLELFRVRVRFDLATIDKDLEEIKNKAKPLGEVITYLPTGEMASADSIELDLLLASGSTLEVLTAALGSSKTVVEHISRRQNPAPPLTQGVPAHSLSIAASVGPMSSHMGEEGELHKGSDSSVSIVSPAGGLTAVQGGMRSVSRSVRVDIRKLDSLMNAVGELAIVKSALGRVAEQVHSEGDRRFAQELLRLQRNFERRLVELQEGILEVRMVPLSQMFDRLTRVVRQISRDVGKEIRFVVTGGETEIDKLIVEELSDPLVHIVRNAIDHGIEDAARRLDMGKSRAGTIALNAYQKGNHVVVEVEDDGGGVNVQHLVDRAVALGKVTPDEARQFTRKDVLALMFLPGLSTRDQADDFSGRGVGMDVVKTNIARLGGIIDLQSETSIGTKISVTLPITLAIVSALLVRVAGRLFAVPLSAVSEAVLMNCKDVRVIDGREVKSLRGVSLPLCNLRKLFQFEQAPDGAKSFVVVATMGSRRLGLVVDELVGQQNIVIKALGATLGSVKGFSGATELGDQRVALVLDVASIIEEVLSTIEATSLRGQLHG